MHLHSCRDLGDEAQCLCDSVQLMLDTDGNICGTVASLAREIEDFAVDGVLISLFLSHIINTEPYKLRSSSLYVHIQLRHSQESNNKIYLNSTTTFVLTLRFLAMPQIQATSMQTSYLAVQSLISLSFLMADALLPQQHLHEHQVLLYRLMSTKSIMLAKFSIYSHTSNLKLMTK